MPEHPWYSGTVEVRSLTDLGCVMERWMTQTCYPTGAEEVEGERLVHRKEQVKLVLGTASELGLAALEVCTQAHSAIE